MIVMKALYLQHVLPGLFSFPSWLTHTPAQHQGRLLLCPLIRDAMALYWQQCKFYIYRTSNYLSACFFFLTSFLSHSPSQQQKPFFLRIAVSHSIYTDVSFLFLVILFFILFCLISFYLFIFVMASYTFTVCFPNTYVFASLINSVSTSLKDTSQLLFSKASFSGLVLAVRTFVSLATTREYILSLQ